MSDRTPAELAREVRNMLPDGGLRALAALAELEAQAEAGRRLAPWVTYVHTGECELSRTMMLSSVCSCGLDAAFAAAAPSPADQEEA